jgi:hypothetical protein
MGSAFRDGQRMLPQRTWSEPKLRVCMALTLHTPSRARATSAVPAIATSAAPSETLPYLLLCLLLCLLTQDG